MAAWWVKIYLPQNYFAIRSVCENRWQIKLTGFSAESLYKPDPKLHPIWTSVHGDENDRPIGEIGTLQQLSIGVLLDTSLFLTNDYQCSRYMGPVYFDDPKSCYAIYATKFYGGPLNQGNR